ncbi:MAG: T9SS type A sorting domain-containing protein [Bacteroidetes bacterium]|nr:T9SS type A sorting domain-containing protein [Bacteroidota bacterium]
MTKYIISLIIVMFSFGFVSKFIAQGWVRQETHFNSDITSLFFLDSLNGWAATDSTFYLNTTDGGSVWNKEYYNVIDGGIKHIQFINDSLGFACGSLGRIISTKDGGKNWNLYNPKFEINFWDLSFVDEKNGWAAGEYWGDTFGRGMIVHTSDGGQTWEKQLELESTNRLQWQFFRSIEMWDSLKGWASACDYFDNFSPTYIYRTTDGGKNWLKLNSPIKVAVRQIKIANNDTLWTDGYGLAPISVSTDSGFNWFNDWLNEYGRILAVSPVNGNEGWACHKNLSTYQSHIIYTTDAGLTWKEDLVLDESIWLIENFGNYVWIAGSNGSIMNKNIRITSVEKNIFSSPNNFQLYQNYPNPFNSQTIISYNIFSGADIEIIIYDQLGRILDNVQMQKHTPGLYEYVWDSTNKNGISCASGIYFYRIKAKMRNKLFITKTSKMVLVK